MKPNSPNPYDAPAAGDQPGRRAGRRPHIVELFIMSVVSLLTGAFTFIVTCVGMNLVSLSLGLTDLHPAPGSLETTNTWIMAVITMIATVVACFGARHMWRSYREEFDNKQKTQRNLNNDSTPKE